MNKIRYIKEKIKEFNTSVKDIHNIKVYDVISFESSEEGSEDAKDKQPSQSVECFAYKILQSKIHKIERKRTMWKTEKVQVEPTKIGTVTDTKEYISMIDQKNCDWKNVSRRTQRSAIIKF